MAITSVQNCAFTAAIFETDPRSDLAAIGHVHLIDKRSSGAKLTAPPAAANARRYAPLERYEAGEVVVHAKFGAGRVVSSGERYVEIAFEVGVKKLAQAPKK